MAQKKKSSKKKNTTLFSAACVLLGLLVILIIFLVKKDQIFTNLKETAFFDKVFGSTPTAIEKHEPAEPKKKETVPLKNEEVTIKLEDEEISSPKYSEPEEPAEVSKATESAKPKEEVKETPKKVEEKKPVVASTTELQLCFVNIDGDGSVGRQIIKRKISKSDSPLTSAINLLLQGPDTTISAERNLMSLIPSGTKLLSAKVSGGVAYLNFNEAFEINTYGVEGYIHQLEQIVFTATAFSTVNSVQFLIEGEKRDYLGSEGVLIASPLSRSSF